MDASSALSASRQFDVISDPHRLRILDILDSGETYVLDLQEKLGMLQAGVSHHLVILKLRGMIEQRRRGKRNYYFITDDGRRLLKGARVFVE
jgi:DNA-binding transcriptional ArsR family regulator